MDWIIRTPTGVEIAIMSADTRSAALDGAAGQDGLQQEDACVDCTCSPDRQATRDQDGDAVHEAHCPWDTVSEWTAYPHTKSGKRNLDIDTMATTIDQRTTPLPILSTESGTERTVERTQRWTRNGTKGHMEDPTLERTRAVWTDGKNPPDMKRGWYLETTDDQGGTTARSGPYDAALMLDYDFCWLFEYDIGAPVEPTEATNSDEKASQARETQLEEQAQAIIRLGLELRIHQTADLWTQAIRERQAQLMSSGPDNVTPTVADVICSERETTVDLEIAALFDELWDATQALRDWSQAE